MLLIMIHGIKFLDTSPLIYVDFDGRNLQHPIVHVLGIFYFQACMGIRLLFLICYYY
jgi:hypothetical protein